MESLIKQKLLMIDKEEILNSYKWIKVPKYRDDESLSWAERYRLLNEHHIRETTFLIEKLREIVKNLPNDNNR